MAALALVLQTTLLHKADSHSKSNVLKRVALVGYLELRMSLSRESVRVYCSGTMSVACSCILFQRVTNQRMEDSIQRQQASAPGQALLRTLGH